MKDGNWIAIHKLVKFWLPRDRPYTELEALISHTIDVDENKTYSVNGYSKLWQWSRSKVRNFLNSVRTQLGHHRDSHKYNAKTQKRQGIVLKLNNLHASSDTARTQLGQGKRHSLDTAMDTTINPNTNPLNPNKKNNNIYSSEIEQIVSYLNEKCKTKYRTTGKKTCLVITARLNEKFTVEDFITVIDKKTAQWLHDPNQVQYLRPETLFGNKFEGYLNQQQPKEKEDPEWLNQGT